MAGTAERTGERSVATRGKVREIPTLRDFRDYIFTQPPTDREVAEVLRASGFECLISLLDRATEMDLLNRIDNWARRTSGIGAVPEELKRLLTKYNLSLTPVAAESLLGIYGLNREGKIEQTELGNELYRFSETHYGLHLFLVHGGSAEATGEKPIEKSREPIAAASFNFKTVRRAQSATLDFTRSVSPGSPYSTPRPAIDTDIVVTCGDPAEQLYLLCDYFQERPQFKGSYPQARAEVVPSKRRPHFSRLEITTARQFIGTAFDEGGRWLASRKAKGISFGHLTFPKRKGFFEARFRLVDWLMAEGNHAIVKLITLPQKHAIVGITLDFYPGRREYLRLKVVQPLTKIIRAPDSPLDDQTTTKRSIHFFRRKAPPETPDEEEKHLSQERYLAALVYHWPGYSFPVDLNFPEAWGFFWQEFRRWTWSNQNPLMEINPSGERFFSLKQALLEKDAVALRILSRRTSIWFFKNIIRTAIQSPSALGEGEVLIRNAKALVEGLVDGFNGDPWAAFLRCLDIDENTGGGFFYPMGIFELLPQLIEFLEQSGSRNISRKVQLREIMANCPFGVAKEGWKAFLDFLFEQAQNDSLMVAQLLTPFSMNPIRFSSEVLRPFDKRFATLDDFADFGVHGQEPVAIINALIRSRSPLTSVQIAEASGLPLERVTAVVQGLRKRGKLVDISIHFDLRDITFGTERERATGRAVWSLSNFEPEGNGAFRLLGIRSKVYVAIVYGRCSTVAGVKAYMTEHDPSGESIGDNMITRVIRLLEARDIIVVERQNQLGKPIHFQTSPSWKKEIMLPEDL